MSSSWGAFLFTDVEGSTRLWDQTPETAAQTIAEQDRIIRAAVAKHSGRVFATSGDGLAAVFSDSVDAVKAAIDAQLDLSHLPGSASVRMGIHAGSVIVRNDDYFGETVNRAARIMSAGHGGQILVSESVANAAGATCHLVDLNTHSLRDLTKPERIFQVAHGELPVRFPALKTLGSYRNNLPIGLTPLLGRENDLAAVAALLESNRCVSIVGPGGVGKTRFASQMAAEVLDRYPGGAFLVELARLQTGVDIPSALAMAIGLAPPADQPVLDLIAEWIGSQLFMVVLDNCEHVLDSAAAIVQTLLSRCPGLRVLATSRERLHLTGEHVYDLPPLAVPDQSIGPLELNPSIRLLADRARLVGATDPMIDDPAAAVAICRRLEGLALAIELAAARLRTMTLGELLESLESGLSPLADRRSGDVAHHSTMTASIDWSVQLLEARARDLYPRLGVFVGSFDVAAVKACTDVHEHQALLTAIIESSLLVRLSHGQGRRYRMLEPIRQHALSQLESASGAATAKARYAEYYHMLARAGEPHMHSQGQTEWLGRLDADIDNLRAALDWLEVNDHEQFFDMATALRSYWFNRGLLREGSSRLEEALRRLTQPAPRRVDALIGLAQICWIGDDYRRGEEAADEAYELGQQLGDEEKTNIARHCRAKLWMWMGRDDEAAPELEATLAESRRLGLDRWAADAFQFLGHFQRRRGNLELAFQSHDSARAMFETVGDTNMIGYSTGATGIDMMLLGNLADARRLIMESNELNESAGDHRGVAEGHVTLAQLDQRAGRAEGARRHIIEAIRGNWEPGARRGLAVALLTGAEIESSLGNPRLAAIMVGTAESLVANAHEQLAATLSTDLRATISDDPDLRDEVELGRKQGWMGIPDLLAALASQVEATTEVHETDSN